MRKYRVPSDPRSQAHDSVVSTVMGDRTGILRAVIFAFLKSLPSRTMHQLVGYPQYGGFVQGGNLSLGKAEDNKCQPRRQI